jgi:uncharacterized membrane protein
MWRAVVLGAVAGMRSQMPAAVLAWRQARGQLPYPVTGPGRLLRRRGTVPLTTLSAVGELLVDKAPVIPSRVESGPLAGRVGIGAVAGSAVASAFGHSRIAGAAWGAGGALLGSVGGYRFRLAASKATGVSDTAWALVEDAVAITLALLATTSAAAAR